MRRAEGEPGFFTRNLLPRMAWSAAWEMSGTDRASKASGIERRMVANSVSRLGRQQATVTGYPPRAPATPPDAARHRERTEAGFILSMKSALPPAPPFPSAPNAPKGRGGHGYRSTP